MGNWLERSRGVEGWEGVETVGEATLVEKFEGTYSLLYDINSKNNDRTVTPY